MKIRKSGGIIALVAGIFGILAGILTLFFGGLGGAFQAEGADTVVGPGWGGIFFSLLVFILGAGCVSAKSKLPGVLLIISAIFRAVLGGKFVAIFMALALIGGILDFFGEKKEQMD